MAFLLVICASIPAAASDWQARKVVLAHYKSSTAGCTNNPPVSRAIPGVFDTTHTDLLNHIGNLPQEVITSQRPEDCIANADLPIEWDWRNVTVGTGTGVPAIDYTTRVRNQVNQQFIDLLNECSEDTWHRTPDA